MRSRSGTLQRLRARTENAHAELEASDLVLPATRDRDRYALLIGAMFSFHRAVEREFRRFESEFAARGLSLDGRYKAGLLERESRALRSPIVAEPALGFSTAAHAAGAVYVMEGSTLGGTIIARSIESQLHRVSLYYGCYGAATAERWRSIGASLDEFARSDDEDEAMCAGAEATFTALRSHLKFARLG